MAKVKAITMVTRDTTTNWNRYPNFIPKAGELIVYTDRDSKTVQDTLVPIPAMKVGDGTSYLADLPFIGEAGDNSGANPATIYAELLSHEQNTNIHVTLADKTKWNNKVSCEVNGEVLSFVDG